MSHPDVAQSEALDRLFAATVADHKPSSIVILGCATGNGFRHIDPAVTERVIGVDINPEYLDILKSRYKKIIPGLVPLQVDVTSENFRIDPVSLVFAGLIFEYVDPSVAVRRIVKNLKNRGILAAVLQLPSEFSGPVTNTKYKSLELLNPLMQLVNPDQFTEICTRENLTEVKREIIPLKQGKSFFAGYYQKCS